MKTKKLNEFIRMWWEIEETSIKTQNKAIKQNERQTIKKFKTLGTRTHRFLI